MQEARTLQEGIFSKQAEETNIQEEVKLAT